ncbi:hypothetical protein [Breoghania sp.]|uniref:hypothetical protein n=1 Tax=Breoghania sp. TaxID=2065378 RepID=UPI002632C80B|nr:hypothetical protein [Breoghania sp.]MDJ0932925.1 hypothetical protein [Breoghania sp.]
MKLRRVLFALLLAPVVVLFLLFVGMIVAPMFTAALFLLMIPPTPEFEMTHRYEAPDKRHAVVPLRQTNTPFITPGHGSDAPGHLCLIDTQHRILAEAPVDMIFLVEEVDWQEGEIRIRDIVTWDVEALQAATEARLRMPGRTPNVTPNDNSLCRTQLQP